MSFRYLIILIAACFLGFNTKLALALSHWAIFTDPTHEISVMLPADVKAKTTAAGGAKYEAADGNTTYVLSFRKRSARPEAEEVPLFCDSFANAFEKIMAESGHKITISQVGEVSGTKWKGRIYRYKNADGEPGAFEIVIAEHHNFVLQVLGGSDTDPGTKQFFSSFKAN